MNLNTLIERFLEILETENKSPLTIINYRGDLVQLVKSTGNKPIKDITSQDLQTFMQSHKSKSSATRARKQASISSFFAWCRRLDYISANPADKLAYIKQNEPLPRPMKPKDVEAVLKAIPMKKLRDKLLFTLLRETGIRISEGLNIYVEDIDLTPDNEFIWIRKPKGKKERLALLADAPMTRKLLRQHLRQTGYTSGPLFRGLEYRRSNAKGEGPLSYHTAFGNWKKYCKKANVNATIHQLRHTVGTELINEGMPLDLVRRRLGHSDFSMVRRYGEMSDETLRTYLRRRERQRKL